LAAEHLREPPAQGVHCERLRQQFHPVIEDAVVNNGVAGIAGRKQNLQVPGAAPGLLGELAAVQPGPTSVNIKSISGF
jgi:hypothetical protein